MPRTKSGVQAEAKENAESGEQFQAGTRVRVWWPPTDDEDKTDYAGMFWPVTVSKIEGDKVHVKYDNGEVETVEREHLQPADPPVDFGKEAVHFQVGEFVEVFNNSKSDPAAWLGKVHAVKDEAYMVAYPFHDTKNERIRPGRLRRARLYEQETKQWKIIKPSQTWEDGEIESPVELETMTAKELAVHFQQTKRTKAPAGVEDVPIVKKRKGTPQRAV